MGTENEATIAKYKANEEYYDRRHRELRDTLRKIAKLARDDFLPQESGANVALYNFGRIVGLIELHEFRSGKLTKGKS